MGQLSNEEEDAINALRTLVGHLVEHEYEVVVTNTTTMRMISLNLDERDRGRVIGSKGSIINSFKTLASALGGKYGYRYLIEIIEEGGH